MQSEVAHDFIVSRELNKLSIVCLALDQVIELPVKHPELFEALGIDQPKVRFDQFKVEMAMLIFFCAVAMYKLLNPVVNTYSHVPVHSFQGVLLYGPPGTGKTLLARAVAHHTECTFIRVSGSELVQKFIGEGARMVRELFVMAR